MAHVFISYARMDGDFVTLLKLELEKADFEVWIDSERLRAGEDWRQGIDDAIKSSFALVGVMTPEAFESKYVTYEWAFALGIGLKVFPLILRATQLHPRLQTLQFLDFTSRTERPYNRLIQELQAIHAQYDVPVAVKRAIEALDSHVPTERGNALGSLAHINHPAAREALVQALHHPYREVPVIAAELLAIAYKDRRAKSVLLEALAGGDAFERIRAAEGLAAIWDEEIVGLLILRLSDTERDRKEQKRVCDAAAQALTLIGTPEALAAVEQWRHERQA